MECAQERMIAIDGGGTKTDFVLFGVDGHVFRRVCGDASNPVDLGFDRSCAVLEAGVAQLLEGAPLHVTALYAGVSGASINGYVDFACRRLEALLPSAAVRVTSDAVIALSSGLPGRNGCVVIAGTGTVVYARYAQALWRVGGWGYLFDGAGGGYDLGRAAITAALRESDGRGPATLLTELLEARIGMPVCRHLDAFYRGGKPYIASFAPLVFDAQNRGDQTAAAILDDTAEAIAESLRTALRRVDPGDRTVVLAGGLFHRPEMLLPRLHTRLNGSCRFLLPSFPPVFGAAAEAVITTGRVVGREFEARFAATLPPPRQEDNK